MKHKFFNITVFNLIFDRINAALLSIRDFFQNHFKFLPTPNVLVFVCHNTDLVCDLTVQVAPALPQPSWESS